MGSSIRSPISQSSFFLFTKPVNFIESNPLFFQLNPAKDIFQNPPILSCMFNSKLRKRNQQRISPYCFKIDQYHPVVGTPSVAEKVQSLDFEFKSLIEPIDRVKRLLHYATVLPPFDESSRIEENRVLGCTTQVWLEVKMDGNGVMRFRVDSDSEITKGFCSCLIWLLDGAEADEVLSVKIEDLVEMNVGLPSRGNSRVNTWHNVLISMQKRTRHLVEERGRKELHSLDAFSSLVSVNGSCKETQEENLRIETTSRATSTAVIQNISKVRRTFKKCCLGLDSMEKLIYNESWYI